ncbi:cyclic nucleotide-binding domain-containing protein [Reinekea forsetii]|nr:cyclic nucleotide-binding domain-containing protein [Reinekea forsetii]
MLLLGERPAYVDQLTDRLKKLAHKLFEELPDVPTISLNASTDLYELESTESLFIVQHGNLSGYHNDQLCMYYEKGDIIGLTECYQLPSLRIAVEDNTQVKPYSADTLLKFVNETKERQAIWNSYLLTLVSLYQDAYGRNHTTKVEPSTGFLNFEPGQTIIKQGDEAHEVFTILQGKAEVFVDDVKVGEVLTDEIFGAMAVFTGETRSATVKAAEPCAILAVPQEEFVTLIKSHPQTTMTLIENMARQIKALNSKIQ